MADSSVTADVTSAAKESSPASRAAASDMMPSAESLDSKDFDAVAYVNKLFPNEQSFGDIDVVVTKLKHKIRQYDEDVLDAVRAQAHVGDKGRRSLEEAKKAIQELFAKIKDIKKKANESEETVQEICRDIKSLDCAKKNLTATITTLNQLKMLVIAVGQLSDGVAMQDWEKVAHHLQSTDDFLRNFEHNNSPQVIKLRGEIASTRAQVHKLVFDRFEVLRNDNYDPSLADACNVVDSLGEEARLELCGWFTQLQLDEYTSVFRAGCDGWGLSDIDQRFTWLKRTIATVEDAMIFPDEWDVSLKLCEEFCDVTREHLIMVLDGERDNLDIGHFLGAIQQTLDTEDALAKRFVTEKTVSAEDAPPESEGDMELGGGRAGNTVVDSIREKYRRHQEEKLREEAGEGGVRVIRVEADQFRGRMSSAFEPFMSCYIDVEDRNLTEMIEVFEGEEEFDRHMTAEDDVLRSSVDLVIYFQKSLKRCSGLTTGQALFDLHKTFKKHLDGYCDMLTRHVPRLDQLKKENDCTVVIKINEDEVRQCCNIISTAVYLQSTTKGMEDIMQRKIQDVFREHVDFTDQGSHFAQMIRKIVTILVLGTATQADGIFTAMTKLPWSSYEKEPTDANAYVSELENTVLTLAVPPLRASLKAVYFRQFCDRFASMFLRRYCANILKIKRLTHNGGSQLLCDLDKLKKAMDLLPDIGLSVSGVHRGYKKVLGKEYERAKAMIKTSQCTDPNMILEFFSGVPDGTKEELQRLCEMQGMKSSDIKTVLTNFTPAEVPEDEDDEEEAEVKDTGRRFEPNVANVKQFLRGAFKKDT